VFQARERGTAVDNQGRRHPESRPRRALGVLPSALVLLPLACGAGGCAGFWDEVTSRDFHFKEVFQPRPEPLWVVNNSPDGDKRAKALRALREPLAHGGTQEEQEVVLQTLASRAESDPQVLCRLAAIQSLRTFKDPRAVDALRKAYYAASHFAKTSPEGVSVLHCQAIEALGDTGSPAAVDLLVKVLREPAVVGPGVDRQQEMDERIAAARALSHFNHYLAAETLVGVLQKERDVALRERANESLQQITGKEYPPDATVWAEYLHHPDQAPPDGASWTKKVLELVSYPARW
jgi:HEAT repeat protein